jgi:hypothetical protein
MRKRIIEDSIPQSYLRMMSNETFEVGTPTHKIYHEGFQAQISIGKNKLPQIQPRMKVVSIEPEEQPIHSRTGRASPFESLDSSNIQRVLQQPD